MEIHADAVIPGDRVALPFEFNAFQQIEQRLGSDRFVANALVPLPVIPRAYTPAAGYFRSASFRREL